MKASLLLVDDDTHLRRMLEIALTRMGYEVTTADGAAVARQLLRSQAFSLVICDYEMPGETGLELLAYVSRVYPDLPFILLTGREEQDLALQAIGQGAIDFVSKPCKLPQLSRLIEQNLARAIRDKSRLAAEATEVLEGTIRALVAAVDQKDPYTATHSERVTRLSLRLGKALGLPEERIRVLEFSAMLHDVGKIGIPDSILTKPGPLTPEERQVIQTHPGRSGEIVHQVRALGEVASIVRHHHERVDGKGYPDHLSGEGIPHFSRLIAIADVYEALTSDRSYRTALPEAEARKMIRDLLGAHLDPDLGKLFLSLRDLP